MLDWIKFAAVALCVLAGLAAMCVGVLGTYRLKFVLNRMHAASMADSLGLFLVAIAMCICAPDGWTVVKLLLVSFFMWITSPTGGHLIARLELTLNDHPEHEMEVIEK